MSDIDMLANEQARPHMPTSVRALSLGLDRLTVSVLERAGYRTVDDLEKVADISLEVALGRRPVKVADLRRAIRNLRRSEAYAMSLWQAHGGPCVVPDLPTDPRRFRGSGEPALA